ncbi:uncharacterized protein SAPINGB_P001868 [Magnusiomyces paraingens]|uniref:Methyltransferase domain-containing protein n=1 Tax=Magnusiomyces paraingens TaxID=2606893 RepID=A0A5E8BC03_9ASCO|nr:uncharacterized protein SAPINGB_P001868 [Saprochaete ingens]VVT48620.1 unnamed protein product [Saprochaete ingens]
MSAFSDSSFTADDYHRSRPQYPLSLFEYIYRYHQSQQQIKASQQTQQQQQQTLGVATDTGYSSSAFGGPAEIFSSIRQTTRALDIACGPGEATVPMSRYFDEVVGLDPSEVMIQAAKRAYTVEYPKVTFVTGSAEEFVNDNTDSSDISLEFNLPDTQRHRAEFKVVPNSVDLISAAEGAHWFDLNQFYHNASLALKPGGTLAIWGYGNHIYTEPGNPYQLEKAAEIQNYYLYDNDQLGPYWQQPGREILLDRMVGYEPQSLLQNPDNLLTRFSHVERHDNVVTARYAKTRRPKSMISVPSDAFIMRRVLHLLDIMYYLKTSSAYHKWKVANPNAPYDVIDKMMTEVKEVTGWNNSTVVTIEYDTFLILATKEF